MIPQVRATGTAASNQAKEDANEPSNGDAGGPRESERAVRQTPRHLGWRGKGWLTDADRERGAEAAAASRDAFGLMTAH